MHIVLHLKKTHTQKKKNTPHFQKFTANISKISEMVLLSISFL